MFLLEKIYNIGIIRICIKMARRIIMKKRIVMLTVAVASFGVGCGSKDVNESHGTQVIENSNTIKDTENEPHTEVDKLDDYMTTIKEQSDTQ